MASDVFFDNPPLLNGSEEEKLKQLYGYLNAMSEKLNTALMSISIEQLAPETKNVIIGDTEKKAETNFDQLKSLIVKTAEIVRTEMDEISTTLRTKVDALSEDFGEYQADMEQTIRINAEGVSQEFTRQETIITNLDGRTEAYKEYMRGYIFTGIIGVDDDGTDLLGVAIGQSNLTNEDDQTLNTDAMLATFTGKKLSFYNGGVEVAYFSDSQFFIANGTVTSSMRMGSYLWKVMANGSMGLMKA